MTPPARIVVIGGGVAGFSAVRELRRRGFDGALTLLAPEGLPYDRPPLSKGYLAGTEDAASLLLAPEAWYAEQRVEVLAARAAALRPGEGAVELDGGRLLPADRVLLATGGVPRRLPVPGGEAALVLRTREDADRLRRAFVPGALIAVVGAGLIGAEVASAARAAGAEVTLIDPLDPPLAPAVGEALARRLHAVHAERGVRTVAGTPVAIEGGTHPGAPGGAAHRVVLADGSSVPADAVVAGIGIAPDTALAEAAGIEADGGVLADASGATSLPAVFAAGDAVRPRAADGSPAARVEHWEAAVRSGEAAAAGMLGQEPTGAAPGAGSPAGPGAPWFWSDRHGSHVEAVGTLDPGRSPGARTVLRELDGVPVAAFLVARDGHLLGAASVDAPLIVRAARRIIDRGIVPDLARLADPAVDPRRLTR
ncbi:NAD(P)/FAD-dependent oxidoreductase [Sinomonas halotolerans]|uniref:FAD-dependent oxidoreductase n=1 Tax=Sinomonas halotolerans TaxID=1644133 RepID=A0ABU9X1E5_9MICC